MSSPFQSGDDASPSAVDAGRALPDQRHAWHTGQADSRCAPDHFPAGQTATAEVVNPEGSRKHRPDPAGNKIEHELTFQPDYPAGNGRQESMLTGILRLFANKRPDAPCVPTPPSTSDARGAMPLCSTTIGSPHALWTNEEWCAFIDDGGYLRSALRLSDGWAAVRREGWEAPLHWVRDGDGWTSMTLSDMRPPDPGFRPVAVATGGYSGKFMGGRIVLCGGSRAAPDGRTRATHRNFFCPHQGWQPAGLRLADDAQ